jgi:hypothetical protein
VKRDDVGNWGRVGEFASATGAYSPRIREAAEMKRFVTGAANAWTSVSDTLRESDTWLSWQVSGSESA